MSDDLKALREAVAELRGAYDGVGVVNEETIIAAEAALDRLEARLRESPGEAETIYVVFDGPPGPECGRFVEVEDATGKSIRIREWVDRGDGFWALRLNAIRAAREGKADG